MLRSKKVIYGIMAVSAAFAVSCESPTSPPSRTNPGDVESENYSPSRPQNMTLSRSGSAVNISWRDQSLGEQGFILEKSFDYQSWTRIASLPENSTSFMDESGVLAFTNVYRLYPFTVTDSDTTLGDFTQNALQISSELNPELREDVLRWEGDENIDGVVVEITSDEVPQSGLRYEYENSTGSSNPINFSLLAGREYFVEIKPFIDIGETRFLGEPETLTRIFEIFEFIEVYFRNTEEIDIVFNDWSTSEDSIRFTVIDGALLVQSTFYPESVNGRGTRQFIADWQGELSRNYSVQISADVFASGEIAQHTAFWFDVDGESNYPAVRLAGLDPNGDLRLLITPELYFNDIYIEVSGIGTSYNRNFSFSTRGKEGENIPAVIPGLSTTNSYRLYVMQYFDTRSTTLSISYSDQLLSITDTLATLGMDEGEIVLSRPAFHLDSENNELYFIENDQNLPSLPYGEDGGRVSALNLATGVFRADPSQSPRAHTLNIFDNRITVLTGTEEGADDYELQILSTSDFDLMEIIDPSELGLEITLEHAIRSRTPDIANEILIEVPNPDASAGSNVIRFNYSTNEIVETMVDIQMVASENQDYIFMLNGRKQFLRYNVILQELNSWNVGFIEGDPIGNFVIFDSGTDQMSSSNTFFEFENVGFTAGNYGEDISWSAITGPGQVFYSANEGIKLQETEFGRTYTVFEYPAGFENRIFLLGVDASGALIALTVNNQLVVPQQYFLRMEQTRGWIEDPYAKF